MAISDWKEWTEGEWSNKKDRYSYAKVWKTGLPSFEVKRRGIQSFIFSGRVGLVGTETKRYFKTKSEAIAFAKEYMRNH